MPKNSSLGFFNVESESWGVRLTLPSRVKGVILEEGSAEDFMKGVSCMLEGNSWLPVRKPVRDRAGGGTCIVAPDKSVEFLTPREQLHLSLIHDGQSNQQIAAALGVKYKTIKNYTNKLFRKLNVSNREEAVLCAESAKRKGQSVKEQSAQSIAHRAQRKIAKHTAQSGKDYRRTRQVKEFRQKSVNSLLERLDHLCRNITLCAVSLSLSLSRYAPCALRHSLVAGVPMKQTLLKAALLFSLTFLISPAVFAAESETQWPGPDYTLAAGDVLDISVWKNEELTRRLTILPDGKVHFPLVGEVLVQGKTVAQLKTEIEERLSSYMPKPVLSVIVNQVSSMLIYVLGKVNSPGRFLLQSNVNVLQGLAVAGGLNPYADRNKIKIFREEAGKTTIFDFEYDTVAKGKDLAQNIMLKRGDVIVVH
jgi:polysaccharide export outer membrane protein